MKKVLIVEDDKVLSLLLNKMVEKAEYEVVGFATAGREAIQKVADLKPDLILMDIMLEDDIDGIDAMNAIRETNKEVPVIYITGNSDIYNRTRAEKTNFVDYLVKPISFDILKDSFRKLS